MAVDSELVVSIVKKLGQLWEDDELSDIKIIIDDFQFNCHRFHLSACSEFFRVLLKSQAKETSNDVITVHITGIIPETFNLILLSVYKGELTVTSDNMLDLWHASHHLQVDFLVNKLEHFISRSITEDNFFIIYKMAVELTSDRIIKSVQSYMTKNFEKISKTEEFLNLSYNCLLSIIGHDDLVLKSRDDLVRSVLYWIDYKPKSRDKTSMKIDRDDKEVLEVKQKISNMKGKKTMNDVDVIFKSRDEVTYEVESSSQRKDKLGELIKMINLDDVSQDCLLTLLNNDDIIECREARTTVRQAFAERKDKKHLVRKIQAMKRSSRILLDGSLDDQLGEVADVEDTVPVVVYLQASFKAILAYALDTRKTYSLPRNGLPKDGLMKNVYSYKNQIYILIGQFVGGKDAHSIYKLQQQGKWECVAEVPDGSHSFMFSDNFIYCVVQFQICRLNMEIHDNLVWICVYDVPNTATHFVMSGNKIVILKKLVIEIDQDTFYSNQMRSSSKAAKEGYISTQQKYAPKFPIIEISTKFAYLDVSTWDSSDVQGWECKTEVTLEEVQTFTAKANVEAASSVLKDVTFLLTKDGLLLRVTHPTNTSMSVIQEENLYGWRPCHTFVGAVRQENVLYLFVTPGTAVDGSLLPKLTSFNEVKVVSLLKSDSNFLPVSVPQQLLTDEIHVLK
ncbi:unnamed protein product [Lymnaea stagnalis]|uniref:BTB domain-containing protein n=1 Tax=Lymnaea stagnalis TaxID=6523 RepID=A0AAV2IAC0_LYMST